MQGRTFRAVTIVVPDLRCHTMLEEAFNAWTAQERPSAILHVHYYHDPHLRVRGYQVIYEVSPEDDDSREPAEAITHSGFKM